MIRRSRYGGVSADDLQNRELFLEVFYPVDAFLSDAKIKSLSFEVRRDEPAEIGLRFDRFLFEIFDLRSVPLNDFLLRVTSAQLADADRSVDPGAPHPRHVTAGVDADADTPIAYRIETTDGSFPSSISNTPGIFLPNKYYSTQTHMVFSMLAIEQILGDRLDEALKKAESLFRRSIASLLSPLSAELGLPPDLIMALLFWPEWRVRDQGDATLLRCKVRLSRDGPSSFPRRPSPPLYPLTLDRQFTAQVVRCDWTGQEELLGEVVGASLDQLLDKCRVGLRWQWNDDPDDERVLLATEPDDEDTTYELHIDRSFGHDLSQEERQQIDQWLRSGACGGRGNRGGIGHLSAVEKIKGISSAVSSSGAGNRQRVARRVMQAFRSRWAIESLSIRALVTRPILLMERYTSIWPVSRGSVFSSLS